MLYQNVASKFEKDEPVVAKPKASPKKEETKMNPQLKVLHNFIKPQHVNIDEQIQKVRKEPDFRKNMFMMDVNIWMANMHLDQEKDAVYKLANVCGAFIYDTFIPGITTHIITHYPDKRTVSNAGSTDNSISPYIVTIQWLVDSVVSGKKEGEKFYLPANISLLSDSCSVQQQILAKSSAKYGTLFKSQSFSIIKDSYSEEEIEELTEKIESNGGSLISEQIENSCSKYLIMNDGYCEWEGFNL